MKEYPNVSQEIKVAEIISGRELILEDGSAWEVEPIGTGMKDALDWDKGDIVHIKLCSFKRFYSYYLKNEDKNLTLRGFFKNFVK